MTIIRGSLMYHCHTLCIVLYCLDNTFTVRCVCVLNNSFRFFSVYISLFCIYYLVWLCIAFFWFNCCYQKPLCEKTENWSSLEWSKAVHLFRVWLIQTLNNGYTCKSFIKLTPELQTQSVLKSVAQSVSQLLGKLFSYT